MSATKIAIELRFLRVATKWTRRKHRVVDEIGERVQYVYVPEVDCTAAQEEIEDPRRLRNEFLRMERSEEAALNFLHRVGLWAADPGIEPQSDLQETRLSGAFGFRVFEGMARPVSLEDVWEEQEYWKDLLKGPAKRRNGKLRAKFGTPPDANARPHDHVSFAWNTHFFNTLPMHLEWKRNAHAILQPMTAHEMLTATTWGDLVSGSPFQECNLCRTPFTSDHKRKFCPPYKLTGVSACAHAAAQRAYKRREDAKKERLERAEKARKLLR